MSLIVHTLVWIIKIAVGPNKGLAIFSILIDEDWTIYTDSQ
jgi:hypothetical protein